MAMKNITFSADEKVIEAARQRAKLSGMSLNQKVRQFLEREAVSPEERVRRFDELMKKTAYFKTDRKFSREEMNER